MVGIARAVRLVRQRLQGLQGEGGAAAVEYGLLVALIAVVVLAAVVALSDEIALAFQAMVDALTS